MGAQHVPGEEVWLIGEIRSTGERKYYLSNLPPETTLKRLAGAEGAVGGELLRDDRRRHVGADTAVQVLVAAAQSAEQPHDPVDVVGRRGPDPVGEGAGGLLGKPARQRLIPGELPHQVGRDVAPFSGWLGQGLADGYPDHLDSTGERYPMRQGQGGANAGEAARADGGSDQVERGEAGSNEPSTPEIPPWVSTLARQSDCDAHQRP